MEKTMTNIELIRKHISDTGGCSFMHHMRKQSSTYKEILLKDMDIVPDILQYLKDNDPEMSLLMLLMDITKDEPYKPKTVGNKIKLAYYDVDEAKIKWINWGLENKYI